MRVIADKDAAVAVVLVISWGGGMAQIGNRITVLFLATLLVGCVSTRNPNETRKETPSVDYRSPNGSKVVALCMTDTWESLDTSLRKFMRAQIRPRENGHSAWLELNMGGDLSWVSVKDMTEVLADIDDTPTGSIVHLFTASPTHKLSTSVVEKCLSNAAIIPTRLIPTPAPALQANRSESSVAQKLRELSEMKKEGLVTEAEFEVKRKGLLDRM
jgi:PBP1b-binding outer membrane lipoprotein LpoB